jgi:hypothetical protein
MDCADLYTDCWVSVCWFARRVPGDWFVRRPEAPTTHWKQDLLPFDTPLEGLPKGTVVKGTVALSRNPTYRRHLRVHLALTVTHPFPNSDGPGADGAGPGGLQSTHISKRFLLWR